MSAFDAIVLQLDIPHDRAAFLVRLAPMAGVSCGVFHTYRRSSWVWPIIVVSRLDSDRRLRATLPSRRATRIRPRPLAVVLLWVGALSPFLATLRPRADGFLYVALSFFSGWLSPPFIAFLLLLVGRAVSLCRDAVAGPAGPCLPHAGHRVREHRHAGAWLICCASRAGAAVWMSWRRRTR